MPFQISLFECWIKDWNISLIGFEWYREENEQQYEDLSSLLKALRYIILEIVLIVMCS